MVAIVILYIANISSTIEYLIEKIVDVGKEQVPNCGECQQTYEKRQKFPPKYQQVFLKGHHSVHDAPRIYASYRPAIL